MLVRKLTRTVIILAAFLASAGTSAVDTRDYLGNFSQYPGFAEYFTANPPSASPATAAEQALLTRYRPRLLLPSGHPGLIDFYRDYIAQGRLYDKEGKLISWEVTPELLNAHKDDPGMVFVHEPDESLEATPVVYGRVDRGEVDLGKDGLRRFMFLRYNAVFRHSGLPAGLSWWRALLLSFVGDLDDWHQLDHRGSATVVLDEKQRPVALMLQQHNYLRTYVFGVDIPLPADRRPLIDVAIRSNELYPHVEGRVHHRAVRFFAPQGMRHLLGYGERPALSSDDITESAREEDYTLVFLPAADAFYGFKGYLGQRRTAAGRAGPPGADYNTLPGLKPSGMQLLSGYWHQDNAGDRERFEASFARTGDPLDFARAQAPAFAAALAAARGAMLR